MNVETKMTFLRRVTLFRNVDDNKLKNLAGKTKLEWFGKKSQVFFEDDKENLSLYIIIKGKVQIRKHLRDINGDFSKINKFIIIGIKKEGDYFGEMSILDNKARSAEVVTVTDTEFLILPRKQFEDIILKDVESVQNLLRGIIKNLRDTDKMLANRTLMDSYQKVAMTLSERSRRQNTNMISYDRDEIAQSLGIDPKYVGQWVYALAKKGFIKKFGYKEIKILKEPFPLTKSELLGIKEIVDVR